MRPALRSDPTRSEESSGAAALDAAVGHARAEREGAHGSVGSAGRAAVGCLAVGWGDWVSEPKIGMYISYISYIYI